METWNADEVKGLICAVDETVREYVPIRRHDAIPSVNQWGKAEQIVWLSNLLYAIMNQRNLTSNPNLIHPMLSPRETDVLRWSAAGKTAANIGVILNLKERTVRFHIANAIKKMGTTNKTAAVAQALKYGIL
ncbi:helix-turn-helix transcriptional regulator [Pseudomonas sp. 10B1]|nr:MULTISPECIES: helix-turn-helix transcriptional regulator [unclassified Pseudomonas]MEA9976018.1 helix-turn-helix transcriptional regulator [Pseudomonas sp. RTS4]MEA9993476.1 helix-turn-helix transcriptional regulator [Pseudomonas sp. AA4]MEB0088585.1 helix-turn-helix transcriptional regulator [Pseudomonas sp. RTI1]MEB0126251.1 helix-turn-helix transcriptional regulator [Pseudomonas sp. CCC1.2]MEB0155050.1 helix-turn-helix transcriptional regulator [Pseudomonas sp. CCC4.3]